MKIQKQEVKKRNGNRIYKCSCSHEYQDKLYGSGMRVQNVTVKGYRCTVCSQEYNVN